LLGHRQQRVERVAHHAGQRGHGLLYAFAFGHEDRVNQVVGGQRVLAHQAAREIVAAQAAGAGYRECGGNDLRVHGTTLGEIQFSMWAPASSRPMRSVDENGTICSAPISARSLRTANTVRMRCPYGSLSALVSKASTGLPVGAIKLARRRSRSVTPRRMSMSSTMPASDARSRK